MTDILNTLAIDIIKKIAYLKVGFPELRSPVVFLPKEIEILDLFEELEALNLQHQSLLPSKVHYSSEELQEAIDTYRHQKEIFESVLRSTETLSNVYYDTQFQSLIERRDKICSSALRNGDSLRGLEREMRDIEKRINDQMRLDRQMIGQLEMAKSHREESNEVNPRLKVTMQKHEILRNTFTGLLLESGVKWTSDKKLCRAMGICGKEY